MKVEDGGGGEDGGQSAAPIGDLHLSIETPSFFFTRSVRAEVRDAHLELISILSDGGEVRLPPGLYQVSAVLDDGRHHSKVVQVSKNAMTKVELRSPQLSSAAAAVSAGVVDPALTDVHVRAILDGLTRGGSNLDKNFSYAFLSGSSLPRRHPLLDLILDYSGARPLDGSSAGVRFTAEKKPDRVPRARIRGRSGSIYSLSLPVNDSSEGEERTCLVRFTGHGASHPRAFIPEVRKVSSALQHMVSQGELFKATELLDQATDLLLHKYRDPVGATLGALILYQTGKLAERSDWLANLRNDFEWMPDARILSGALSMAAGRESEAAEYLLSSVSKRPMFTLSFSILIDSVRRWRFPLGAGDFRDALEYLGHRAARVDWSALTLTLSENEGALEGDEWR